MNPTDLESDAERRLGEALRAALPPRPPGSEPARAGDDFFASLAAEDAAVGIRPPDVTARVVAAARRAAAASSTPVSARRPSLRRRVAAAAALFVAIAGLAGAAIVAVRAALRNAPPPAPPPAPAAPPIATPHSTIRIETPAPSESAASSPNATPVPTAPARAEVISARPAAPAPAEPPSAEPEPAAAQSTPADRAAPEDAFAFYRPEDARTFLVAWQESLLPLSSAVTQEVGAVAIVPDGADSAAWFAALWPDRAPDPFPALLLDDLGDAVLTNLAASAASAVEAPEDYDPAWLIDETLPGIPAEHREALLPFYDPALVTLSFDSYPDAARFAELLGDGDDSSSSPATPSSLAPQAPSPSPPQETPSLPAKPAPSLAAQPPPSLPPQAAPSSAEAPPAPEPPPMPDFKLLQRLLYQELVVPFYAGPDGSTYLSSHGARQVWKFALELGRGRLALVPNREWGGAYDLVVRNGVDDPFLRFCAAYGSRKWGWNDKSRELRDDLAFRLAGGDATPFQTLLLAHLDALLDPGPDSAAALRDAFPAWSATLAGEFDRDDVRAWFRHWLVEAALGPGAGPVRGKSTGLGPRAAAIARHAADPAPDASPAPGAVPVHEDSVQATSLPLLLREVVAPLEARDSDRAAPWRPMALAALRDWCLGCARGERRLDPLYAGRAVSAAGRGCPWSAIRFLAALKNYDDTAWDPETAVYGHDVPDAIADAARRVVEALVAADADPATTPLARLLMHRAAAARRHPPVAGLSAPALGAAYLRAVAEPRTPAEARALWLLAPDTADWPAISAAASDPWLREMALGRAALAQSTAAQSTPAQSTAARSGAARAPLAREAFARAASLRPAFPEPWIELLRHCAADPAEARDFYDEAARRELDAPGAADAMLAALRPSRGGSAEALLAFGDDCLATGRFDTRLPVAWAKSRFIAASLAGAEWEAPFRGERAITNMNLVADSVLASPLSDKCDRRNALYMRIWPLYANNEFEELVRTCDAFGQAEGYWDDLAVDFDPGHPMRRQSIGISAGFAGYHHEDIVAAMRAWRVDGDLAAARDILRARAGRVSAATNTVDNWEQSFLAGRLAVLDCALARPGDPPYSLIPKSGKPGPRKFWRSRAETVHFYRKNKVSPEHGTWWTDEPAGQIAASEPVLPARARLSLAVSVYVPTNTVPSRFWIVPEALADPPAGAAEPVLGLLLEGEGRGRCTLGWARLRLFDLDTAPVGAPDGPRVRVEPPTDGIQPIELDLVGGDVVVRYNGRPVPELRRSGLVAPDRPHAIAFAGHRYILYRADVAALPTPSPAEPEPHAESAESEPHAESAESEPHAESAENAESEPHAESAESAEPEPHAESAESAE